jgi:hypothetical protein
VSATYTFQGITRTIEDGELLDAIEAFVGDETNSRDEIALEWYRHLHLDWRFGEETAEERGRRLGLLMGTLGAGDPHDAAIAAAEGYPRAALPAKPDVGERLRRIEADRAAFTASQITAEEVAWRSDLRDAEDIPENERPDELRLFLRIRGWIDTARAERETWYEVAMAAEHRALRAALTEQEAGRE